MTDLRFGRYLMAVYSAYALLTGCGGGAQSIPGALGAQPVWITPGHEPPIQWVPSNVILSPGGKTKRATLQFLTRYGGAAYQIDCVGRFSIGRARKSVKGGTTYLNYPLTAAEPGPYRCTWAATVNIGRGQKATSTLLIIIKR
jgi:hypothetical protein